MKRFRIHAADTVQRGAIQPPIVYVKRKITWEYKQLIHPVDAHPTEAELNELGESGWELVGVFASGGENMMYSKRYVEEV